MIAIDWLTKIINVPQSYLSILGGSRYGLDLEAFRNDLKNIEDTDEGMPFPATHARNAPVTLSGVTYAQTLEIVSPYSVTFQNTGTPYVVVPSGANHNLGDKTNFDGGMSLVIGNAAGLIAVNTGGGGSTGPTEQAIAAAVRSELAIELARIDAAITSRLATAGYTSPPTAIQNADAVLLAAETAPIAADIKKINARTITGTGVPGDSMRPV